MSKIMTRCLKYLPLVAALALAVGLAANGIALAQPQPQLLSDYRAGPLPLTDPLAPDWDTAPVLIVPLVPQVSVAPALSAATVPALTAQSLNDGEHIVFRLTWADAKPDWHATLSNQFRDAAAIQLPAAETLPGACMGAAGQLVNLWHWKADWQWDLDAGFHDVVDAYPNFWQDIYPFAVGQPPFRLPTDFAAPEAKAYLVGWTAGNPLSTPARVTPVEDLSSMGFGTVTAQADQGVLGRGVWKDGKWYVVFARGLASADPSDAQFAPGDTASLAFAVWDGADRQVGARKQLSSWTTLLVVSPDVVSAPAAGLFGLPILAAVVVLVTLAGAALGGLFLAARRRAPAA